MRIDRMLGITMMMLNRDRVAARELAERFGVSVRTIYRDLEAVNQAGIPVVSHSGNRGGYGIMDTFRIDRQFLTFEDILAMVSVLRGVNSTLENQELDLAVEKIASLLPRHQADWMAHYSRQVVIDILPLGYTKRQKDRLKTVHQAVVEGRLLRFTYSNNKGEKTVRCAEPMTLIFKGYAWYLFAFCRLREDYRLFRLSRMDHPEMLDASFEKKDKAWEDAFDPDPSGVTMAHLKLRFSPAVRVRVEDYFEPDQIRTAPDGSLYVEVCFPEDQWIYSFLLGYGEHVEVLEPPHIREFLRRKAEKIQALYKPDNTVSRG
ncbi:MAG TPA: YafY family transcriptional regulator [bacterium]|nr:YafY family transcriptional regulator [bacterium]